jgi:hypothetical protein
MNKSSSSTPTRENLALSYQQLLRLRELVQEAEQSLAPHQYVMPSGCRINPQRRRQA